MRDPAFRAALNTRRQQVWENSLDRVRSLLPRALDVVEHALDDDERQAATHRAGHEDRLDDDAYTTTIEHTTPGATTGTTPGLDE